MSEKLPDLKQMRQALLKVKGKISDVAGLAVAAVAAVEEVDSQKQDKLSGLPGQAVGFDSAGNAAAVQGWSNPNLLANWYFLDPINQRNFPEDKPISWKYFIDRWLGFSCAVKYESDGMLVSVYPGNTYCSIMERLEGTEKLIGKTVTASALINGELYYSTGIFSSGSNSLHLPIPGGRIEAFYDSAYNWGLFQIYTDRSAKFLAVKLELGSQQTLARQDADGAWVLNDPPPDKTLELLKCQRYFQVFSENSRRPTKAADFRPVMRTAPTLGTIEINGTTYYTASAEL